MKDREHDVQAERLPIDLRVILGVATLAPIVTAVVTDNATTRYVAITAALVLGIALMYAIQAQRRAELRARIAATRPATIIHTAPEDLTCSDGTNPVVDALTETGATIGCLRWTKPPSDEAIQNLAALIRDASQASRESADGTSSNP